MSPDFADATYTAVRAAMHRRQRQIGELHVKLTTSLEQQRALRHELDETTAERRRLDQCVIALSDDNHSL